MRTLLAAAFVGAVIAPSVAHAQTIPHWQYDCFVIGQRQDGRPIYRGDCGATRTDRGEGGTLTPVATPPATRPEPPAPPAPDRPSRPDTRPDRPGTSAGPVSPVGGSAPPVGAAPGRLKFQLPAIPLPVVGPLPASPSALTPSRRRGPIDRIVPVPEEDMAAISPIAIIWQVHPVVVGAIMAASLIVTMPVLARGLMATLAALVAVIMAVTGIATMLTVVRIVDRAGIATMAEAVQTRKDTVNRPGPIRVIPTRSPTPRVIMEARAALTARAKAEAQAMATATGTARAISAASKR